MVFWVLLLFCLRLGELVLIYCHCHFLMEFVMVDPVLIRHLGMIPLSLVLLP